MVGVGSIAAGGRYDNLVQLFTAAAAGDAKKRGSLSADVAEMGGAGGHEQSDGCVCDGCAGRAAGGAGGPRRGAAGGGDQGALRGRVSLTLADAAVCGFRVQEEAEGSGVWRSSRRASGMRRRLQS